MNERIRELAKRKAWNAGGGVVSDLAVEAIAELIVAECVKALENNKYNLTIDSYCDAIEEIQEHFGVEE